MLIEILSSNIKKYKIVLSFSKIVFSECLAKPSFVCLNRTC